MAAFSSAFSQAFDALPGFQPSADYLGLSIEILRIHAGLQPDDSSKDEVIDDVFNASLEALEAYLDRFLRLAEYSEENVHIAGREISLKAYPLESVQVVEGDNGAALAYHAEKTTGVLKLDAFYVYHLVSVVYVGGYRILPGPLLVALLATFDNMWAAVSSTGGTTSAGKEIKAMTVDGMRVEYNVQSSGNTGGAFGMVPATFLSSLEPYRRVYA